MIDIFIDDVEVCEIRTIKEGQQIFLKNEKKDETISFVLSDENFIKLNTLVHNKCELRNLIPIMNR